MIEKLDAIEKKYDELTQKLADPAVIAEQAKYREYARHLSELEPLVRDIKKYRGILVSATEVEEMLREGPEPEMEQYLRGELQELNAQREETEEEIRSKLISKDPNDQKNIIVEIRAGAGGNEASLFAGDLYRMYTKYAESHGWSTQMMSSSPSDLGGFKEIIFEVKGRGAYSRLKYESGVHRVQRIPVTEAGGRIHTSTATVAVLPEAEEVEVEISPNDLRVDIFRSSGPGGQSVNTTDSAVRITHVPTGIVVQCQEERSQLQNRERALKILRARLYERLQAEQQAEVAQARRMQIGSADRSERIRTYNFPQGRVTDHRIGLTLHKLDSVLEGEIDDLVEALAAADRAEKLKLVV
jgi:peptide chain release factor 1